jgi:2-polyprenyl-3-methyl-5-hydroxy-6-metoxy-1,4-benzoquinol methylase
MRDRAVRPGRNVRAVTDLDERLARWRADLAAWAIPEHITAAVSESPWVLPRQVFARRADRMSAAPSGPSYQRAFAALDPPGSVLDVGSGAGTACLPLLPRVTSLTAVDTDPPMLEKLSERTSAAGVTARTVVGRWPEAAAQAGPADVVTCHHVLYNVPEVRPFVMALTESARRTVVAEITTQHPLVSLNALWLRFHGLRRPRCPTAADLIQILETMGLRPGHETWRRAGGRDYASFDEMVDVTRRRLCLPTARATEVADALADAGIDPQDPEDLGSSGREVVTLWWEGTADL